MPEPIPAPLISSSGVWGEEHNLELGQTIQVVAKSGKGKSTLLHIIYGLRSDHEGVCEIDEVEATSYSETQWLDMRRKTIDSFPPPAFRNLSARENLDLLPQIDPESPGLEDMCKPLEIAHLLDRKVGTLSLGQCQRLALVRCLRKPFKWLLLDEPFSHLDEVTAMAAAELIKKSVQAKEAGLIFTSLQPEGPMSGDLILIYEIKSCHSLLDHLYSRSPGKTIGYRIYGMLIDILFNILALEIFLDSQDILTEDARDFITLNKKVRAVYCKPRPSVTKPFQLIIGGNPVAFPFLDMAFFTKSFPVDHKYMASRQRLIGCGCTDGYFSNPYPTIFST